MDCKVNGVYKNLRYRILVINSHTYILDLGKSFWKIIFPFLIWILPNPLYKIENKEIVEKLKTPEVHQTNTGGQGLIGGGIAVLIANLLRPLTDYFNIQSSTMVNSVIVIVAILLLLSLRLYINHLNKKNLYRVIEAEKLTPDKVLISPKPIKHFFLILGMYLFFLAFTILLFIAFIQIPNILILLITMSLWFLVLFTNSITIAVGNTRVKFISKTEQRM
ncbi:hypothetical conserved protein [Oceanobacillus iheyensis HTE831]|uniref:Hypothetical conserved protein n=1 Tax=Oceanobacillus iheyensis (strain DSM 14371 / CIP 107618 / JCM 11309 / KCTC 3954 / HTE831) TaxID=221109 RepID=Q8ERG6_OCEIH|nr:DUF443 domain-containing protein [Oceanobacillus iheyensis]BAC13292.1 hypothetical conserved protein [Oceanobacillus iheyensis HTE831]